MKNPFGIAAAGAFSGLCLFMAAVLTVGCSPADQATAANRPMIPVAGAVEVLDGPALEQRGIRRIVDKEAAVVCYQRESASGTILGWSCLPLSQTGIRLNAVPDVPK